MMMIIIDVANIAPSGAGMGVGGWRGGGWTRRNTGLVRSRKVTYLGTKEPSGSVVGETAHTERIWEHDYQAGLSIDIFFRAFRFCQ